MTSPARRAAYDVTRAVESGRVDLASALAETRDRLGDPRDRALATDIAVGTQRWRAQLDYLIAQASGRSLARLDAEVLDILRLSTYQLRYLTRVPASAVVHDAVDLARAARKRSAAGLVNAVLRKLASTPPSLPSLPDAPAGTREWHAQAVAYLATVHSHPAWLVERWLARYGWDATLAWVTFDNTTAPVTLWPAPGSPAPAWPPHTATMWVPGGVMLDSGQDAVPLLSAGQAFAQDEASAAVGAAAAVAARPPVLDACAAPGGKSLVLAATLPHDARLIAADVRTRRVATLRQMLQRLAGRPVPVLRLDAGSLPFAGTLGTVLVDAPCSGLGTLRRDPDLRWRRTPDDLATFAAVQRAMLREALSAVHPGGRVVYATCSSEPDENEALVAEMARESGWTLVDLRQAPLPGRLHETIAPEGWLRTLPHRHGLEAFFAAVLERPVSPAG
jgi:16S rRNA (cytosine967-C5)-methyltransferase